MVKLLLPADTSMITATERFSKPISNRNSSNLQDITVAVDLTNSDDQADRVDTSTSRLDISMYRHKPSQDELEIEKYGFGFLRKSHTGAV